jgi:hypothetical protein
VATLPPYARAGDLQNIVALLGRRGVGLSRHSREASLDWFPFRGPYWASSSTERVWTHKASVTSTPAAAASEAVSISFEPIAPAGA